ncbi:MAG TPA: DNA polymerase III subunit alpha, partial [Spirochaetia bacterium]|nr:DNA polymerase III subunit alpha [Spirochaetia bacterium]
MKFIWLEIHSACSMEAGNIFISDLASFAAKHGFSWVGLADSNGFYGLLPFISACREKNLKALVSVRIKTPVADALLVARSMRGYAHLCRIITLGLANDAALKGEIIKNCQNNFMVISADFSLVKECRENGFAEINPLMSDYFTAYQRAHAEKLEPVLIYPVYFISPADYRITRILSAVRLNKKLDSLSKEDCISEEAYFLSEEEICRRYAHMPDALDNTVKIAQKVFFEFNTGGIIMPEFTGGDFYTLKNLVEKNLPRRYAEPIPAAVLKRLKDELAVIREKNFAGYFLIVHDIVKKQAFTCGRGSGAASLVAYLLYITHVDPVKHCLFFERFLNLHREDPPDIDIDFPWDTRDQVLEYVFEKYGTAHAAMVANHVTFSLRSALRECAKIRSLEETEISRAAQSITHYYHCKKDQTITRVSRQGGAWAEIYRDALPLCGILRYLSVHCGGVVITPKPVSYYAPVEKAPKGVPVIQFDKDQAEDFGLVKIDLLGNRSLAVARDALSMIEKNYNIKISYADFNPLDDQKTISLLAAGNSMGVFYVESPAMRQLQKKTGHGDFEHLVIHSSMIRPAANRYIREYIARLHGKPWQPLLPEMKELLAETFGIMCYQE